LENPYVTILLVCAFIIISYLFNLLADRLKIPSVILLIASGVALHYMSEPAGIELPADGELLNVLGIIGLIFIVLEGSLDLELSKKKIPLVTRSFITAALVLIVTSAITCFIFVEFLGLTVKNAIVFSVPFAVISSSIAIPSARGLTPEKREFITYESSFSDIIGIMLFNYVILENPFSTSSVAWFFTGILLILLISAASTVLLLFLMNYVTTRVKFFLIFALLILIYCIGKLIHLPSLLLVLVFGLMLNNLPLIIRGRLANYLQLAKLKPVTHELKQLTEESAFLVRTFFFLLFGYSMSFEWITDFDVLIPGSLIILTIFITRYFFLRFFAPSHIFPELFIAPRGLITIVLFYSIPAVYHSAGFNEGILYFVIIVSALIMMAGLMFKGRTIDPGAH
jgi:Kef-type K+ transport system membrane component KefB